MASLKELKTRINSVNSTKKITSAMKMIASAKLHKAQGAITNFLPYQQKLDAILTNVLSSDSSYDTPFTQRRENTRVGIVVFASNTSLCGAYNSNVIKEFVHVHESYQKLGKDNILIYPVGKKIAEAVQKRNLKVQGDYTAMADTPTFADVQSLAKKVIDKFVAKELDEVVMIYHHFISSGTQKLVKKPYLPFDLSTPVEDTGDGGNYGADYLYEPSKIEILDNLIPTVLHSRLYAALLSAHASEHASRMIAMQTATDNAEELNDELSIQYNKTRQQAVTNELLDIIGGSSALS